ncbi:MAG: hypothetical protein DRP64_00350, partial [Verrucomicrobia bacterium]
MMIKWTKIHLMLTLMLVLPSAVQAQTTLPEKLVTRFSSRWDKIQVELSHIGKELEALPVIPLGDLGGTGGLISYKHYGNRNDELNVFVRWDKPAAIDLVALVPARRFNWDGLDPEFGLSNFIEIELLDGNDNPVYLVARENAAASRPVQKGFPFVYPLPAPVQAHGVRIRCREYKYHEFPVRRLHTLALAELFCFSGRLNVAEGAEVRLAEDATNQDHWLWRAGFLVDGLTPLGLPEFPAPDLRHIGWCSYAHASEDTDATIDIEFHRPVKLDGMRMFPSRTTTSEDPPGFALPQRFRLIAFDEGFVQPTHVIYDHSENDMMNPGHNPATFRFPETTVQRVRLECSKIWKNFPHYPAFLSFSEIQLLHGETNLAEGTTVSASERKGIVKAHLPLLWSEESLTDGFGPQGKLVPQREWLLLLDQRLELETRQQALSMEADNLATTLQRRLSRTFGGIGILAILALFILPVRYRRRERLHLGILRQRIADDLHDEVGANLSSIAGSTELLSEITEQQSPKQKELLLDITRTARKTVKEARALVYFLDRMGFEGDLAKQFMKLAKLTLGGISCELHLANMDAFNRLPPTLKWDLLLFCKEALHNIYKHADADRVEIKTYASAKHLHLSIMDNGKGLA